MSKIFKKLERTFEDVTDITDPSSMEKVLAIFEQSRLEDDEFMQVLVDKLHGVEVTWEQPPYQLNDCLTEKPPPEEAELCASGRFTKAEGELVKKNWKNFVQQYNVPDKPICYARWKNRNKNPKYNPEGRARRYVAAYLARGLHRNLYQVFKYFRRTYAYPVKLGKHTATEEKIMEICFFHQPEDACVVAPVVLGREPRAILKQLTYYYHGKPEPKRIIKWTLDLAAKLIRLLIKYSGCSFQQLKYNTFDQQVWLKLGKKMGQLYRNLREFWFGKLHVQLFAKCAIKLKTLRKIIFKKLKNSPYEVWSDIRWKDFEKEFPDGFTYQFLYNVAKASFRGQPSYRVAPLHEVMEQAVENNKLRKQNRRLLSLQYDISDGTLTFIKHDITMKHLMKEM
ncbi:uncharacterized protein LOC134663008 [Cydia amplana]|uniref:uncharacterized protein LOC134663008 n=1 Tax=Cydia amplana TaxID=1869771 RepID=UPI002FE5D853